jgi:ribosomal-protein-serine acetyltransferase
LTTNEFRIRPYRPQDTLAHFDAVQASRAEIAPWLPWLHSSYGRQDSVAWVDSRAVAWVTGSEFSFVVEHAASSTFVGSCGLNKIDRSNATANLTFWTDSRWTRRGAASAGARAVLGFGMTWLALYRIEIYAAVGNVASLRVAEKVGAKREGLLRGRLLVHGRRCDAVLLAIVAGR